MRILPQKRRISFFSLLICFIMSRKFKQRNLNLQQLMNNNLFLLQIIISKAARAPIFFVYLTFQIGHLLFIPMFIEPSLNPVGNKSDVQRQQWTFELGIAIEIVDLKFKLIGGQRLAYCPPDSAVHRCEHFKQ